MLDAVVDVLRCPTCAAPLSLDGHSVDCSAGHRFDLARQGYVNLLAGAQPHNADTAAMVQARLDFLAAGHYDRLIEALPVNPAARVVLDAGSGPGRYLATVLDRVPAAHGLACDVAVAAARRAARSHPRAGAVVADTWAGLPVRSGAIDVVLVIFAPRNFTEFARIVRPGGTVVIVTPGEDHLDRVRAELDLLQIPRAKVERDHRAAAPWFVPSGHRSLRYTVTLSSADITNLVGMGPNAFHRDPAEVAALAAAVAPLTTTVAFEITELTRRDDVSLAASPRA